MLARTSEAARHLSNQFHERTVEKQYLAVVEGVLQGIGEWVDYIAKPGRKPKLVPPDHGQGKRAELRWQALDAMPNRSLLQVELGTGRPHQIRLQTSDRGHPIVGDHRYGAESSMPDRTIALHHAVLRLDHPVENRRKTFVAAPPSGWNTVLASTMESAIQRMLRQAEPPGKRGL